MRKFISVLKNPGRLFAFAIFIVGVALGLGQFFKNSYFNLTCEVFGWLSLMFAFQETLLPIKREEMSKFIPLVVIFCSAIFIYTICRQLKDTLVIGGKAGAVGAVYAKGFVLIGGWLYQYFYVSKISRKYSYSTFAYFFILPLLAYFVIFNFFLLDNPAVIPSKQAISSLLAYSSVFKNLCTVLEQWPRIMYYVVSEIWSVAVVSVLCWKLANKYVEREQVGRFYPALIVFPQFFVLFSGYLTKDLFGKCAGNYKGPVGIATIILLIFVGVIFLANYYFFKKGAVEQKVVKKENRAKVDIMCVIRKNPKFFMVALIVVYYGLCSVLIEQFWKDKVKMLYKNEGGFGNFMGTYYIFQSRLSILLSIVGGNLLMRYTSWFVCASLTPLLTIVGSFVIFGTYLFGSNFNFLLMYNPLNIVVFLGFGIVAMFKTLKYVSTDPSKEEYIAQQSAEDKCEIKNLEGMLGRIGKSGGAMTLIILFTVMPHLNFRSKAVAAGLFISSLFMGVVWLMTVYSISKDVKRNR